MTKSSRVLVPMLLSGLLGITALLSGCSSNSDQNNNVSNNVYDRKGTLQGTIFDATTGARINDKSLKVTLIQGTDYRSPNVLKKNVSGSDAIFAGDYAFNGIPLSLNNNNITYRLVATVDGYQMWEGYITPNVNWAGINNTYDGTVNMVGNIYMFPMGATANDVTVNVTFNNEPVAGTTVQLQPQIANNVGTTSQSGNTAAGTATRLGAATGTAETLSATTDANGVATFSGANLVLGGQYQIMALPITYQGTQLAETAGNTVIIGTSVKVQSVAMGELVPGADNGLYIVNNSNADTNNIQSNGVLTLVFSRPVTLINEPGITATLGGTVRSAALNADSVVGAMSSDGLTLTLTPNFTTAPVVFDGTNGASAATPTADIDLTVTYNNVTVVIADGNDGATANNISNLTTSSGNTLAAGAGTTVQITGPEDY